MGVAHAVPIRQVVAGFGPIASDNRRVLRQEWLAEAFTMWGTAAIVIAATTAGGAADARAWVYRAAAGLLVALATLTALTARAPRWCGSRSVRWYLGAVPGCCWPRAGCSAVVPGGLGRLRLVVRAGPGQA
jgi:hypothetical protein